MFSETIDLADFSFHESTVVAFAGMPPSVYLKLTQVRHGERLISAEIVIDAVVLILLDRQPASAVAMEYPDGEVLTLDLQDDEVRLIVKWNDFATCRSAVRSYIIRGTAVVILHAG